MAEPDPNPYEQLPYSAMSISERDQAVRRDHPEIDEEIKASAAAYALAMKGAHDGRA